MANGKPMTNDKLYEALNSMRLEIKGDIRDLRNQFDTLEAGRLTRAEQNIQDLRIAVLQSQDATKQNQAVLTTKFLVLQTVAYVILFVILQAIANRVVK